MASRRKQSTSGTPDFPGFTGVAEIGGGGFSTVYSAKEIATSRTVALKLLNVRNISEHTLDSFKRETTALGILSNHPNIVTLYRTLDMPDGRPVLVMERCKGTVAEEAHRGILPPDRAVATAIKVLGALETAHRADMLHQDVKPRNLLITEYGEPALADFGMARLHSSGDATSAVFGFTTLHAAPELLEGSQASAATDVYEMGSTLYHLLAGRAAFRTIDGEAPAAVILRILRDPVRPLHMLGVPPALSDAVLNAMAKGPEDRPATALQFAHMLQEIERQEGWESTDYAVVGEATQVSPRSDPIEPPIQIPPVRPAVSVDRPTPGASLREVPEPGAEPVTAERAPMIAADTKLRTCSNGHSTPSDDPFCDTCGAPLNAPVSAPRVPIAGLPPLEPRDTGRPPSTPIATVAGTTPASTVVPRKIAGIRGQPAPVPAAAASPVIPVDERPRCLNDHPLAPDDEFCSRCGSPVDLRAELGLIAPLGLDDLASTVGEGSNSPLSSPVGAATEPAELGTVRPGAGQPFLDPDALREIPMKVSATAAPVQADAGAQAAPPAPALPAARQPSLVQPVPRQPRSIEPPPAVTPPSPGSVPSPPPSAPPPGRRPSTSSPATRSGGQGGVPPVNWVGPEPGDLLGAQSPRNRPRGPQFLDPEPVVVAPAEPPALAVSDLLPPLGSTPAVEPTDPTGGILDDPAGFGFLSPDGDTFPDPLEHTALRPGLLKNIPDVHLTGSAEPSSLGKLFKPLRKRSLPTPGRTSGPDRNP
jgi:serine/threonine protein kinase